MTGRKIRWNHYTDHMGGIISVRAVQDSSGKWREFWTTEQLMRVDLSRDEPDTQEENPVVFRTVSEPFDGSKPHPNTSMARRATKNTYRKGTHRG